LAKFSEDEIIHLETAILFAFDFNLMMLTPLHFVYSFTSQGFIFGDKDEIRDDNDKNIRSNQVLSSIRKYAEFFADLSTHCTFISLVSNLYSIWHKKV